MFRLLAERKNVAVKVFYTWGQLEQNNKFDPGFGKHVAWDIPLLEGYEYVFVKNVSKDPGSHHYKGIDNPTLLEEIKQWNPHSILVFGWSFKSHLKVLRHFKEKVNLLFRGDSNLLDEKKGFSFRKAARNLFLKWVYKHIDSALYTGEANKQYYLKYGLKKEQLIFAPHAVDNSRFFSNPQNTIRPQLQIPAETFLFLFAGKFEDKKNPLLLLEAFINAGIYNTHLLFVGNGELETALRTKVNEQKPAMQQCIHFMEFQNQSRMPEIYNSCDVFVLPSQGPGETWGLSVNEAMACSKAVLVSDKCGCYPDLVQEGVNGFIFHSNDINELTAKMKVIASQSVDIEAMGKVSRNIICNCSFSKICTAIEQSVLKIKY